VDDRSEHAVALQNFAVFYLPPDFVLELFELEDIATEIGFEMGVANGEDGVDRYEISLVFEGPLRNDLKVALIVDPLSEIDLLVS
jgi:hypothetical protein